MVQLKSFTFNPFGENTYVLFTDDKKAIIFDPGCYTPQEEKKLDAFITDNQLSVQYIINTHCHIDHILGNDFCKTKYGAPLLCPSGEVDMLKAAVQYGSVWGINVVESPQPDGFLESTIALGNETFEIRSAPGHSPDHKVFVLHSHKWVIGGDVLFQGSIGRTDLPGGDFNTLEKSIKTQLYTLPDDYTVFSGHGQPTTIGEEKRHNPFVKG